MLLLNQLVIRKVLRKTPCSQCFRMDAKSFSRDRKGRILDAKDFALSSPEMNRSYSQKNLAFSFPCFGGIFSSRPEFAESITRRFGPIGFATTTFMTFSQMFFVAYPFKIIGSIVRFIFIFVMDTMSMIGFFKPTKGNHPMVKDGTAIKISFFAKFRAIGLKLFKNFPTTRNGIEMAEESIFDSVYRCAQHVVPFGGYIAGER